jgi:hypothetical protein
MEIRVTGVDRIIAKLKAYQKSLEDKQHRLLEELAKVGIDVAAARFSTAQYDGDNDVVVNGTPEWVGDNKLFITATGQSVTFIEFGTGIHYAEQHPKANALGFVRGAYGQGKGSRDSWGYYGSPGTNGRVIKENDKGSVVITHGNPPARAMYDSAKEMRNQIVDIAREVFGSD